MILKINKVIYFFLFISFFFLLPIVFASQIINHQVPFTSQAPLGEWDDLRQQDACEEAVVLMSMAWIEEKNTLTKDIWREKILDLVNFQIENYNEHADTSLEDIVERMFISYFSYNKARIENVLDSEDIILELEKGNLVLVPVNGQVLKNPNFTSPGPERHTVLIKGYDYISQEFITNDPGTRNGADYRYDRNVLFEAIRVYKTGYHEPFN